MDTKMIILMVEDTPHIFTSKKNMSSFLLRSEDREMDQKAVDSFLIEHIMDTAFANYSWDYFSVDE